jgi:hypothetical protein
MKRGPATPLHWRSGVFVAVLVAMSILRIVPAQVPVQDERPAGSGGCAPAVMIDPASGNRFAAADPRRDCYAMAY